MKKRIFTSAIMAGTLGIISYMSITHMLQLPNPTNYFQAIENQESLPTQCNNTAITVDNDTHASDGQTNITNYKIVKTEKNILTNISKNVSKIFYTTPEQLYTQFIMQVFNLNSSTSISNINYDETNNDLTFATVNSATNKARISNSSTANITKIHLNQSIYNVGSNISNLVSGSTSFVKLDVPNTIQGFKQNYLSLKIDTEYLRSLMIIAMSQNAANKLMSDKYYESYHYNYKFIKVVDYIRAGKIMVDHVLTTKIYDNRDFIENNKTANYWLTKVILDEDIGEIDNPDNWIRNYHIIEKNNMMTNDDQLWKTYDDFLFNNEHLKLEVEWNSPSDRGILEFPFVYDLESKLFIPKGNLPYDDSIKIVTNKTPNENNRISINSIHLTNNIADFNVNLGGVGMTDENEQLIDLEVEDYNHKFDFDLKKIINVRQDLPTTFWNAHFSSYGVNINSWVENPEQWVNDKKFNEALTDFSSPNSPIRIVDIWLEQELNKDQNKNLYSNKFTSNYIKDYQLKGFNSTNAVEFKFNYYARDPSGGLLSDQISTKTIRYSFTSDKTTESTLTEVLRKSLVSKIPLGLDAPQLIVNEFIGYNGERDNKLLTTALTKHDWVENALNNIEIIEHNANIIRGIIHYAKQTSVNQFINNKLPLPKYHSYFQIDIAKNAENSFNDSPNEIGLNTNVINSMTIAGIVLGIVTNVIIIFLVTWFVFKKYKQRNNQLDITPANSEKTCTPTETIN